MEPSVAAVHEAIAAAARTGVPRLPRPPAHLGQITERTRRLANHLLGRASAATPSGATWPATRAARTTWPSTCYNGNEYLEAMLGAFKARVAPFNVNYRYVAEELRYLLVDAQRHGRRRTTARFAPDAGRRARPELPDAAGAPAGGRRLRPRRCCPARSGTRTRSPARRADRPTSRGRPTTSTSSTPAARPGCPRACCGARPTSSSSASAARAPTTLDGDRGRGGRQRCGRWSRRRSCTAPATG